MKVRLYFEIQIRRSFQDEIGYTYTISRSDVQDTWTSPWIKLECDEDEAGEVARQQVYEMAKILVGDNETFEIGKHR